MLNRLTVNVLLKFAVGLLAATIVIGVAFGAWGSWGRLVVATRIAHVGDASAYLFTALHNLRLDRSTSVRSLQGEAQTGASQALLGFREAEMTALNAGLMALRAVDLPVAQSAAPALERAITRQVALHRESAAAMSQPKAQRRAALSAEVNADFDALMAMLDKLSVQLANAVKLDDAYVDQLMQLKQLAWLARNSAGDASVMISNKLAGLPLPADPLVKYAEHLSRAETAWTTIEEFSSGLALPPQFTEAVKKGKQDFFSTEAAATRLNALKMLIAGGKNDISLDEWVRVSIAKLSSLLNVADISLQTVKEYAGQQRSSAQWKLTVQVGLLALAFCVALSMMVMISRRVIAPLQMIQKIMVNIAAGDFTVNLPPLKSHDEVGQIVMSVNAMVDQIRVTIGEIKSSSREVTNASAEIATSTTDLSQRTEEQAASLEETSASMEEISTTVRRNAESAQAATRSATATSAVADRGGEVAARAVKAMARIEESSRKISDIISVIDEIARQTNLLALNAAVEAARAGEAGRGFAVVASEVRSLAQRSSQAAKDIAQLITTSGSQVQEGVGLVNQAGEALNEIVESIRTVTAVVSDIATASAEQASGLDEIKKALTHMDEATQRNSALVEENAATSLVLEKQAKAMDEQVAFFHVEDGSSTGGARSRAAQAAAPRQTTPKRARAA